MCQIVTLEDALGPELRPLLCFLSDVIFLILDILKYMKAYESMQGFFGVYEGV